MPAKAKAKAKSAPSSAKKSRSRSTSRGRKASPSPARSRSTGRASKSTSKSKTSKSHQDEVTTTTTTVVKRSGARKSSPARQPRVESPSRTSSRIHEIQEHLQCSLTSPSSANDRNALSGGVFQRRTTTTTIASDKRKGKACNYSFCGPCGTSLLFLGMPVLAYALNFLVEDPMTLRKVVPPFNATKYFDLKTAGIFFGFFAFQALIALMPIGRLVSGLPLSDNSRLKYRCNAFFSSLRHLNQGFFALVLSLAVMGGLTYAKSPWIRYVYVNWIALLTTSAIFSTLLSFVLYIKGRRAPKRAQSSEGNTGCWPHDIFMGRELNPRVWHLDLKSFCELRVGLIGWLMVELVFCAVDWMDDGHLNHALALVTAFHFIYVADCLLFEESMLSTFDITHEGFGFMLCFGNLTFVPFVYSITAHFLLHKQVACSTWTLAVFVLVKLVGFVIFRGSNSQKFNFQRDPHNPALAHLPSVMSSSGRRLLAGGWWGLVRHPNYLGDIIMSIAWSLPAGFTHFLPWFYPIYFIILIVDRVFRVERVSAKKHGSGWDTYCERVRYRLIPRIF